jgi:hypothetical protein
MDKNKLIQCNYEDIDKLAEYLFSIGEDVYEYWKGYSGGKRDRVVTTYYSVITNNWRWSSINVSDKDKHKVVLFNQLLRQKKLERILK